LAICEVAKETNLSMNKKQQLLTSLISEINQEKPKKEIIINGLSELE